jgi:hypothetical protein
MTLAEMRETIDRVDEPVQTNDGYLPVPPNARARRLAHDIVTAAVTLDFPPTSVHLDDACVGVIFRPTDGQQPGYADIDCNNDGEMWACTSIRNPAIAAGIQTWMVEDIHDTVRRIREFLNR